MLPCGKSIPETKPHAGVALGYIWCWGYGCVRVRAGVRVIRRRAIGAAPSGGWPGMGGRGASLLAHHHDADVARPLGDQQLRPLRKGIQGCLG